MLTNIKTMVTSPVSPSSNLINLTTAVTRDNKNMIKPPISFISSIGLLKNSLSLLLKLSLSIGLFLPHYFP